MVEHLAISDSLRGRATEAPITFQQGLNLVEQARREHPLDAGVDPTMQLVAGPREAKNLDLLRRQAFVEVRLLVADGTARKPIHLQRSNHSALVVGMQLLGG